MSRMSLEIKCVDKESDEINGKFMGVNLIKGKIGNMSFEFPQTAMTQNNIKRSNRTHVTIDSDIIQYYYQNIDAYPINKIKYAARVLNKYAKIIKEYPKQISDINFDYVRDYKLKFDERDFIIRLQNETNSLFLTDVETDRNQPLKKFTNQLENLGEKYSNKIICPTIDLNALPQIFLPKLQYIMSEEYPRFNVVFGGFKKRQENWLSLSKEIFAKSVWCNVVNLQRPFETFTNSYASNVSIAFTYGIHTISVGYPRIAPKKDDGDKLDEEPTPRLLNRETLRYEITDEYSKPKSDMLSFNNQQQEAKKMRAVIGKEFFKEYAKKDALKEHLNAI